MNADESNLKVIYLFVFYLFTTTQQTRNTTTANARGDEQYETRQLKTGVDKQDKSKENKTRQTRQGVLCVAPCRMFRFTYMRG